MKYNCGIYQIKNLANERIYIGASTNIKRRRAEHFSQLKYNKEHNYAMQKDYNQYGKECFYFDVLIYCEEYELSRYEQLMVDILSKNKLLYNICLEDVKTQKGVVVRDDTKEKISKNHANVKKENHPMWGRKHSDIAKEKISESHSGEKNPMWGRRGEDSPFFGKPLSEEAKKKISLSNMGKVASEKSKNKMSTKKQGVKRKNKKYVGIRMRKNKWNARITFKGTTYNLGSFVTEIEAVLAYNQKALELYGESAKLNIIEE